MSELNLSPELCQRLASHTPSDMALDLPEAAVLVAVTNSPDEPEVILTRRAKHMNSHAGQVAFPGGKKDETDIDLYSTALREAEEEIALPRNTVKPIGRLSQVVSRQGILVTPFIASVSSNVELVPNKEELDAIFNVPLSFFLENLPDRYDRIRHPKGSLYIPCFFYDDYEIWGLSSLILVELLNVGFDADYDVWSKPEAVEIRYL